MPNLIRWTQTILEGSKIVLFLKYLKKMKINQKFAKKAVLVASLTAEYCGETEPPMAEQTEPLRRDVIW